MRADKDSIDYQVNLVALQEMEEVVPMTLRESDGMPLNYLQAFRIRFGYSSGPWDYWKGSDTQLLWDEQSHCFLSKDEFF